MPYKLGLHLERQSDYYLVLQMLKDRNSIELRSIFDLVSGV